MRLLALALAAVLLVPAVNAQSDASEFDVSFTISISQSKVEKAPDLGEVLSQLGSQDSVLNKVRVRWYEDENSKETNSRYSISLSYEFDDMAAFGIWYGSQSGAALLKALEKMPGRLSYQLTAERIDPEPPVAEVVVRPAQQ